MGGANGCNGAYTYSYIKTLADSGLDLTAEATYPYKNTDPALTCPALDHYNQLPQELRTLPRSHPGSLKHLLQPVQQLRRPLQLRNIRRQVQEGLRQMLKKILLHQEDEDNT